MDLIDVSLSASYILIILCALSAIIIPLVQSFGDPQTLVKSGIGIVAVAVIFLISYAVAGSVTEGATATTSKMVGGGIITTYILFLVAIVGIVYTEISKVIK